MSYDRDPLDRIIRKDAAGAVTTYVYDTQVYGHATRIVQAAGPDGEPVRTTDAASSGNQ
ncbi:hypothetical protein [Streptomyces sp. enrichment culture]|uniref:hypothetical protein n=1 Tax=Streptomyces sp. enrichment culture TaxID=1795815 RepID=UPI003F55B186